MKYRKLGKTTMRVSVVGVGTWQLGGEWGKRFEQSEVDAMLGKAADLGVIPFRVVNSRERNHNLLS
jgi:aryl-alcohol dehydrogenase-like predicted oxidoreductase